MRAPSGTVERFQDAKNGISVQRWFADDEGDAAGMTGYLTTHVLDTARGCPAEGLKIALYRLNGEARELLATLITNADGRTDRQILPAEGFATGTYELVFHAGAYLDAAGTPPKTRAFSTLSPFASACRKRRITMSRCSCRLSAIPPTGAA